MVSPMSLPGLPQELLELGFWLRTPLDFPFVYVRPEPKSHGRQNQVEGHLEAGQSVVVIEDLISTGKSSLNAVRALRSQQVDVKGMIAVFTYGFSLADANFAEEKLNLHTLSDYAHLIEQASETNYIEESQMQTLLRWKSNPQQWK